MRNQPRNVVGDERMWAGMIPGLGLMNYLLGLFTVPIEVFLRRNFGERYFTRMNFIGGLVLLALWTMSSRILGFLNPFTLLSGGGGGEASNGMFTVTFLYIIVGTGHFLHMWWNDVSGKPAHSYSAGRSWLTPVGKGLMYVLNVLLDNIVRLIFRIMPNADPKRLPSILPVLRDCDTFTERFVEPCVVLFFALRCFSHGYTAMGFWLFFSVMALNLYTGLRHQAERGVFLDYRDQMIDAEFYRMFLAGEATQGKGSMERLIRDTTAAVEKNPDVLPIIEAQNPTLARAIEAMSPKLRSIANQNKQAVSNQEVFTA